MLEDHLEQGVSRFLTRLRERGFMGEIADDRPARTVFATDNSIYQVVPSAVIFPMDGEDLAMAIRLATQDGIPVAVRGGGTGTNGQSLNTGVAIDVSRHMTRILALDVANRTVTVEPGVVLDRLNSGLAPHGLFFPPNISTANRATIGGMVGTDASGKGSRKYGRTSDYIEQLDVVLADGEEWCARTIARDAVPHALKGPTRAAGALRQIVETVTRHRDEIARRFPVMNRGLTGYNLKDAMDKAGNLHPQRLLAGSEGTLAVTRAITLRLCEVPKCRLLIAICYRHFDAALRDVTRLLKADPLAVEVIDDTVMRLAQKSVLWQELGPLLRSTGADDVGALSLVELIAHDEDGLERAETALIDLLNDAAITRWTVVRDPLGIRQLWSLRETAVGLLGKQGGARQGTPFVEDTAVPPENLPAYVAEFRAILDRHELRYGMFGHADVGCLHVRPALDMKNPRDAALIRPISEEVAALTERYGGLLWGEHGRGFRGEFSPLFFGPTLYAEVQKIKAAFDPCNILNPGKLAGESVTRIDEPPTRGVMDRQIAAPLTIMLDRAIACNGNGLCFSWDGRDTMCPSYKVTRDRLQSPKGRAALLREWGRLLSLPERDPQRARLVAHEGVLAQSLRTCLSCKACTSQCPVQVDIPTMKAQFLQHYHRSRPRRLRDLLVSHLEMLLPLAIRWPKLANRISGAAGTQALLRRIGLVDLPTFHPAVRDRIGPRTDGDPARTVILVPDIFNSAFDGDVLVAARKLLTRLGYTVRCAPVRPSGKPLQVLGFLKRFARVAARADSELRALADGGAAVIGLEPATVLMDRQEYRRVPGNPAQPAGIRMIDEFLADEIAAGRCTPPHTRSSQTFRLFAHCTEKTASPAVAARWRTIFAAFALTLSEEQTGCCGMAGLFGHELENTGISRDLFVMSWANPLAAMSNAVATGFSCRCQAKRMTGRRLPHPVEVLLDVAIARSAE